MLYPYHLSEFMIQGLRVTPFAYYHGMMKDIMAQEKSYDSLPNFTAADCEFKVVFCLCWLLLCWPLLIRWRFPSIFQYIGSEYVHVVPRCDYVCCIFLSVHFGLAGLRLLGIGRNQYIDLMNATKTNRIVPVSKWMQCYTDIISLIGPNIHMRTACLRYKVIYLFAQFSCLFYIRMQKFWYFFMF